MFLEATKMKLRVDTERGQISVEDLWDLPLTGNGVCLDGIAKALNKALSDSEESFVGEPSKAVGKLQLQFDIVRFIIKDKLKARKLAKKAKEDKDKKERILRIIEDKEVDNLKGMGMKELKKMAKTL